MSPDVKQEGSNSDPGNAAALGGAASGSPPPTTTGAAGSSGQTPHLSGGRAAGGGGGGGGGGGSAAGGGSSVLTGGTMGARDAYEFGSTVSTVSGGGSFTGGLVPLPPPSHRSFTARQSASSTGALVTGLTEKLNQRRLEAAMQEAEARAQRRRRRHLLRPGGRATQNPSTHGLTHVQILEASPNQHTLNRRAATCTTCSSPRRSARAASRACSGGSGAARSWPSRSWARASPATSAAL